ncbi:unnamed protein product [Cuscuta europaea]|uniref:Uncharacterized protein n=1 Tax=Cuscuta europaea TaxID=41803 RepID=A0A9P0ZYM8_CUSEU|nr:unnamed protein product [Cuscuta europaea]
MWRRTAMGGDDGQERRGGRPHAVMIPYPYQGHVTPFVYLAIKLASTAGFTVTFVNTQHVHSQISKSHHEDGGGDLVSIGRRSGLDIRYVTVSDGFPLGFDRSLNHDQFKEGLLHVFSAHVDEVVGDLARSADPPVTCLIADTFFTWTSVIAGKYDLVNVSFWTEPALVLCLYYHLDLLKENGHFAAQDQGHLSCQRVTRLCGTCVSSINNNFGDVAHM